MDTKKTAEGRGAESPGARKGLPTTLRRDPGP